MHRLQHPMKLAIITKASLVFLATAVYASHPEVSTQPPAQSPSGFCATLEAFNGQVEILDPSRQNLQEVRLHAAIPCGGWVSIEKGWAYIRHRDGFHIRAGEWTFIQLQDVKSGGVGVDQAVLFKGQAFVQSQKGDGELRVATPNARARIQDAISLVLYSQEAEETQLMALENSASLENRLQTSPAKAGKNAGRIVAKEGESTSLNLKAMRTVPSTPRAAAIASVREKLNALSIEDKEQKVFLRNVYHRQGRKFAELLHEEGTARRSPAGLEIYERHKMDGESKKLHTRMESRVVGGHSEGFKLLHPNEEHGRTHSVKIQIEDHGNNTRSKGDELERKRLMEELSQLRPE